MSRRRRIAAVAVAVALVAAVFALGGRRPPHLVIVTLDTTRADHLGLYGYVRDTSPHLDALGREASVFDRAYAPMATTLPTHVSLFTSLEPAEHGITANLLHTGRRFVPSDAVLPLAAWLDAGGYATGGFVSATPLKKATGVARGFDHYDEPAKSQRRARVTVDAALDWLSRRDDAPFFLWVHLFDAHNPYEPPKEWAERFRDDGKLDAWLAERRIAPVGRNRRGQPVDVRVLHDLYDGEIAYADAQLGRLLDALRARPDWDELIVVVAADHGEGLSQHGEPFHGLVWGEHIRVPLVMKLPGRAPARVDLPVSLVDVVPTLIGAADFPDEARFLAQASGRDVLAPGVTPRPILSRRSDHQRTFGRKAGWALTTERFRLVRDADGGEQLYDLQRDPHELVDVHQQWIAQTRELTAALEARIDEIERRAARYASAESVEVSATEMEELTALGYAE